MSGLMLKYNEPGHRQIIIMTPGFVSPPTKPGVVFTGQLLAGSFLTNVIIGVSRDQRLG